MSADDRDDEELLDRLRAHDEEALQALLARYYERLCHLAFTMIRQHDLAEEAVSNVFLSLWRRRETLTITTNVRGYLFAATGKQAINVVAAQGRHDLVSRSPR